MFRLTSKLSQVTKTSTFGIHTSATSNAISRFNLPAMSPTMTEGTIHKWKKKEGETFAAGDVLLELETDKAQIDVEASEDGILAKIVLQDGSKAPVNTLIALLAEEGDDISSIEIPAEESQAAEPISEPAVEEKKEEKKAAAPAVTPISHHEIDTSKLKKPLSPAVLSLVLKYGIKDIDNVKASGNGGRILKGDVLAHLGLIKPKPAPKATLSIAPPRDQIVFAKKVVEEKKQVAKEIPPSFISKQIAVDELLSLRHTLNEQNGTHVSVNDFIAKAAELALQDVTANQPLKAQKKTPIVYSTTSTAFTEKKYSGGQFKVFNLAEPNYDFITDSYQTSKPYVLTVDSIKQQQQSKKQSVDSDMLDLIGYLGGEQPSKSYKTIALGKSEKLDFAAQPKRQAQQVQVKLDGLVPGKILNEEKASAFLHRVEYYIRNPTELVV